MKTLTIQITSRLPADVAARLRALVDRDVELTTKIALRVLDYTQYSGDPPEKGPPRQRISQYAKNTYGPDRTVSPGGRRVIGDRNSACRTRVRAVEFYQRTAKPDGTLATEDRKNPRHKTDSSDGRVILDLKNTVDGSLCVILYDFKNGKLLSGDRPVCWEKRQSGQKTLVNNMPVGSEFNVIAMKDGGSDNDWGGSIYY